MPRFLSALQALAWKSVERIERAAFVLAAANASGSLQWVQKEDGAAGELRPPTKEEWAAHVVAHAEALKREASNASP